VSRNKADREKSAKVCKRLAEEDRHSVASNEETSQLIIAGMGELHLEINRRSSKARIQSRGQHRRAANRLSRDRSLAPLKAKASTSNNPADAVNTAMPASNLVPRNAAKGVENLNKIVGGAVPKEYIPAIIDGIEEACKSGVYAGYQVIDIKVENHRWFLPRSRFQRNGFQNGGHFRP